MKQAQARNIWIAFSIVCFVGFFAASSSSVVQQFLWTLLGLSCATVIGFIATGRRVWARSAWSCVAGAAVLIVLINIARMIFDAPPRSAGTAPTSVGVALTAVFTLLTVAAYLLVSRHRRTVSDSSGIVDSAIVFVAAAMIATEFLVYPFWSDSALNGLERFGLLLFDGLNVLLLS